MLWQQAMPPALQLTSAAGAHAAKAYAAKTAQAHATCAADTRAAHAAHAAHAAWPTHAVDSTQSWQPTARHSPRIELVLSIAGLSRALPPHLLANSLPSHLHQGCPIRLCLLSRGHASNTRKLKARAN